MSVPVEAILETVGQLWAPDMEGELNSAQS